MINMEVLTKDEPDEKYVTYLGKDDNDYIIYKVSKDMIEDVKYSLELVYRMREHSRNNYSKKLGDSIKSQTIHLPTNVEFEKNSPTTFNLIIDQVIDNNGDYVIKVTSKVGQDLKYGISLVYKKRKKKEITQNLETPSNIKKRRGPNQKRLISEHFDYNIKIPPDF